MKRATIIACALLFCLAVTAETARWPLRIVETTSTVNTLTGAEIASKSKEKCSVVAVDIAKVTVDGAPQLTFKRRVTKSMVETESETGTATVPFERRQDLLDALIKAKTEMSRPYKADSSDSLFKAEGFTMDLVGARRQRTLVIRFGEECTFELEPVHTSQFLELIKRIK